ncbi:MAG TPA: hypothetical protein VFW78_09540 [Bacteroidia bacterium]|nr:hypothetical protein [Bacteroidia bacterium]
MKKALIIIAFLFPATLFISCDGSKKTTENKTQEEPPVAEQKTASEPADKMAADVHADAPVAKAHIDSLSGNDIVDRVAKRLTPALELSAKQSTDITAILTTAYTGSGRDLAAKYAVEEGRKIMKELTVTAKAPIEQTLSEAQKVKFEQFLSR